MTGRQRIRNRRHNHVHRDQRRNHRRRGSQLRRRRARRGRDDPGDRNGPEGRQDARRLRLLRHAGRDRSAHASRHAVHGHQFGRQLRQRHARRALRRHHDAGRFRHPRPRPAADGGDRRLGQARGTRDHRLRLPHVHHLLVGQGQRRHGEGGRPRRHHLQAFHGLQGRADGQRRGDVRLVLALRGTRRDAARARRERRHRARAAKALHGQRHNRTRGARAFASTRSRGRGDQPRDHAGRSGGMSGLYRPHLLHSGARGDPARAPEGHARLWRAADPASRARRERILQQGLEALGAPGDVAAVPRQEEPGRSLERPARGLAASRRDRPLRVHDQAEGIRPRRTSPRFRTAPAASRIACRCSGPTASARAG